MVCKCSLGSLGCLFLLLIVSSAVEKLCSSMYLKKIFYSMFLLLLLLMLLVFCFCFFFNSSLLYCWIVFLCLDVSIFFFFFTLQYCIGFAIHQHASTTSVHMFAILNPPSHLPPHTIPLGHPSAPAPSFLYPASNLDWQFISYMISKKLLPRPMSRRFSPVFF